MPYIILNIPSATWTHKFVGLFSETRFFYACCQKTWSLSNKNVLFFGVLGIIYDFKDCLWQPFGIWCRMMIPNLWKPEKEFVPKIPEYVVLLACFLPIYPISNRIPKFPARNFLFLECPAGNYLFLEFPTRNFKLPAGLCPNFRWEILKYHNFIRYSMGFIWILGSTMKKTHFSHTKPIF